MAPRTRKNESANQRNGNGSGNSNSATSHAKAGPSSSRPTRRSSRQPATATSKRRSTQNATNLMGHQSMSDDSDFDTFPKGHTLTSRSNRGPAAAVNKRSAEDPSSSSSLAITTTQKQKKLKRKEDSDVDMKSDEPENRPSTPSSESSGGSEFRMEEESEDDEWEEVAIPGMCAMGDREFDCQGGDQFSAHRMYPNWFLQWSLLQPYQLKLDQKMTMTTRYQGHGCIIQWKSSSTDHYRISKSRHICRSGVRW